MKKFLILLMMLLPLQMYAGTTSMDAQAEKVVDVKLEKGDSDKYEYLIMDLMYC